MSEFVECQNCNRRFFAENLDCPYCAGVSGGQAGGELSEVDALLQEISGASQSRKMTFVKGPLLAIVALLVLLSFLIPFLRS